MLKINRLKISILSSNKEYQFDETFEEGLNFIASDHNTRGKSSVLIAIYYCLGFEEIVGGVNQKVLTSAYKTMIEEGEDRWPVLESGIYLEISNGEEDITIYRSAKSESRDAKLVTVYFAKYNEIYHEDTTIDEFYVHMQNAANNVKGFHHFLEKFIGLELPLVPTASGVDRKLYLQLIFSSMFIEQKNGWSGIYSGMPYLQVKDARKRITEYVLGLSVFENERKRNTILNKEKYQKEQWKNLCDELNLLGKRNQCYIKNIPAVPEILKEDFIENIHVVRSVGSQINIDDWIKELQEEHDLLKTVKPKVIDNYEELEKELYEIEDALEEYQKKEAQIREQIANEKRKINELNMNLEILKQDIINNKDANKLKELGSELQCQSFEGVCPICNQKIQDSLLSAHHAVSTLTISETIKHLEAQKDMLEFALEHHKNRKAKLEMEIEDVRGKITVLFRLGKTIRRDLYSVDDDLSETIIYKRMSIENHIEELEKLKQEVSAMILKFISLSQQWKKLLEEKSKCPDKGFTDLDKNKLKYFEKIFIENLHKFNYTSISNVSDIVISRDNYLPVIDKFDMKFDSSASDNVRAIWSYTLALLETSKKYGGNHPGVLIFDEPAQHSIGAEDTKELLEKIVSLEYDFQVIIGITVNNEKIISVIEELDDKEYNYIHVLEKAFV